MYGAGVKTPSDVILLGACEDTLKTLPDNSVDAIVEDPPYGLGTKEPTAEDIDNYLTGSGNLDTNGDFMGKDWQIPTMTAWREKLRVLKPGRPLFFFAGTRTWDLLVAGAKAAGFEDHPEIVERFGAGMLQWVQGQGFPKSLNVFNALKKMASERPDEAEKLLAAADKWQGWGTALKPSWEPILTMVKPGKLIPLNEPPDVPFFYTAKATKSETNLKNEIESITNDHPTKKPLNLMQWLIRMTTPKGGLVLDCYAGSGSTCHAAIEEKRHFIGIEMHEPYFQIASRRVEIVGGSRAAVRGQQDLLQDLLFGDDA